jgi:hypothetical protein
MIRGPLAQIQYDPQRIHHDRAFTPPRFLQSADPLPATLRNLADNLLPLDSDSGSAVTSKRSPSRRMLSRLVIVRSIFVPVKMNLPRDSR